MKTQKAITDLRDNYTHSFGKKGHGGEGWYFWDINYPEEGSIGPYATEEECKESIASAAYEAGDIKDRVYLLVKELQEATTNNQKTFIRGRLFQLTYEMEEHPDWYEWDCSCVSCRTSN
jgi:hypothetical protein